MKVYFLMDNGHEHIAEINMDDYKDFRDFAHAINAADNLVLTDLSISISKVSLFGEVKQ